MLVPRFFAFELTPYTTAKGVLKASASFTLPMRLPIEIAVDRRATGKVVPLIVQRHEFSHPTVTLGQQIQLAQRVDAEA
jgi:hypothetical protein